MQPTQGRSLVWAALVATLLSPVAAWEHGMMIDAGSGGTRVHFFRWPERIADPMKRLYAAVSIPQEMLTVETTPGISAFAYDVDALEPYMQELLNRTKEALKDQEERWYLWPIYMYATAGARDLLMDSRDAIFDKLREILFSSGFRFETAYWARTISGEEEGAYAWLTANALAGTFRGNPKSDTWGSLDMGGSSTQIAFLPRDISIIQNYYPLHVSSSHIHLYAHSYLEFGYRDANARLLRKFLHDNGPGAASKEAPMHHPCFPQGSLIPVQLHEPFDNQHRLVWVQGTGNLTACEAVAEHLLNRDARCYVPGDSKQFAEDDSQGSCAIAGEYEPQMHKRKFVAMGQYTKIAQLMGLSQVDKSSVQDFRDGIPLLCDAAAGDVEFEAEVDDPEGLRARLEPGAPPDPMSLPISRCWKAVWLWTVLQKGLRFKPDHKNILFASQMRGRPTGWALGAMMHEVNFYPWNTQRVEGGNPIDLVAGAEDHACATSSSPWPFGTGVLVGVGLASLLPGGAFWAVRTYCSRPRPGCREPHAQQPPHASMQDPLLGGVVVPA